MYNYVEAAERIWIRQSALLLVAVLTLNSLALPQTTQLPKGSRTVQVKGDVRRPCLGEKSRVKVKLLSKAEVKGYISKIEDTSFDVTDKKTRQRQRLLTLMSRGFKGQVCPPLQKSALL